MKIAKRKSFLRESKKVHLISFLGNIDWCMTSIQAGTDSGYGAISPYRLYLMISDLSTEDREFMTLKPSPLAIVDKSLNIGELDRVKEFMPTLSKTIYGNLLTDPRVRSYLKFIQMFRLQNYLNSVEADDQITAFIPLADMSNFITLAQKGKIDPSKFLRSSIIKYPVLPIQLMGRTMRMESFNHNHYILTHSPQGSDKIFLIDEVSDQYPNQILQSIKTDNGYLYLIQRPIIPTLI